MWEDESNVNGGKWIVRLKKGVAARYWEDLVRSHPAPRPTISSACADPHHSACAAAAPRAAGGAVQGGGRDLRSGALRALPGRHPLRLVRCSRSPEHTPSHQPPQALRPSGPLRPEHGPLHPLCTPLHRAPPRCLYPRPHRAPTGTNLRTAGGCACRSGRRCAVCCSCRWTRLSSTRSTRTRCETTPPTATQTPTSAESSPPMLASTHCHAAAVGPMLGLVRCACLSPRVAERHRNETLP